MKERTHSTAELASLQGFPPGKVEPIFISPSCVGFSRPISDEQRERLKAAWHGIGASARVATLAFDDLGLKMAFLDWPSEPLTWRDTPLVVPATAAAFVLLVGLALVGL